MHSTVVNHPEIRLTKNVNPYSFIISIYLAFTLLYWK